MTEVKVGQLSWWPDMGCWQSQCLLAVSEKSLVAAVDTILSLKIRKVHYGGV